MKNNKKKRVPPNTLKKQWKEARPQLTQQMMNGNPNNPFEIMQNVKQIDEYPR